MRRALLLLFVAVMAVVAVVRLATVSDYEGSVSTASPLAGGGAPPQQRFKRKAGITTANTAVYNSKMGNATVRAELGRSTWTLLHTIAARYAEEPSAEQQEDTLTFLHLLARLYPCGDCASHFQAILQSHPPDVRSRDTLIAWACDAHNVVNARLDKPQFDCSTVRSRWICGCASEV